METLIINADKDKLEKIKAYLSSLKVRFEVKEDEEPYKKEFVEKIMRSKQQADEDRFTRYQVLDNQIMIHSMRGHY